MDVDKITDIIKKNYNIKLDSIEKIKNIYKITSNNFTYCIKVIKYELPHFKFILTAILHIQNREFLSTPKIIKTNAGEDYIEFFGKFAYLCEWVDGRESNYDNPVELASVSRKLAEFHRCSEDFILQQGVKPRIGWFNWIRTFNVRKNEMLDFKRIINSSRNRYEFDEIYLDCISDEIMRAKMAINEIKASKYLECMSEGVLKRGFCHHDYANHNVLIDRNGNINVIDFDYCILDTNLHDLGSLMIRSMKNGKWDIYKGRSILNSYQRIYKINEDELEILKGFIRFPQEFWQLGIQRYWEKQPWSEQLYLRKLKRYIADGEGREKYINTFFS